MVVALRELEIRGEIRTTVEYVIRLLQVSLRGVVVQRSYRYPSRVLLYDQTNDYVENRIDTSWLDGFISNERQECNRNIGRRGF